MTHSPSASPVDRILSLLDEMTSNSQEMSLWKNVPLSREVVSLLRTLTPEEGDSEDKADVLDRVLYNLSEWDVPRYVLEVLSYEEELLLQAGSEEALRGVRSRMEMLRDYIDPSLSKKDFRDRWKVRSLDFDEVERTPKWEEIYLEVERECDSILEATPRGMGFCHAYWPVKMRLLEKRYGIAWKSPSRMNPRVHFD